jgi:predicted GIY-YIG superfamily endonuclease
VSHVYLIHLEPAFGHARHYVGYTTRDDVNERVEEHRGGRGANMLRHAVAAGVELKLVRVWRDVPRKTENKIKGRSVRPLCPECDRLYGRYRRMRHAKVPGLRSPDEGHGV